MTVGQQKGAKVYRYVLGSLSTDSVLVCGKAKSLSPQFLYLCVTLY